MVMSMKWTMCLSLMGITTMLEIISMTISVTNWPHSGLKNILAACPWLVHTVVGGFHLLDGQELTEQRELSSSLEWPSRDGSRRSQ